MTSHSHVNDSILAALATLLAVAVSRADITPAGDVSPTDPSTWTASTAVCIGNSADGSLLLNSNAALLSALSTLGYNAGVTGIVTVDHSATWSTDSLVIGLNGGGSLSITNSGHVTTAIRKHNYLGQNVGASGTVSVDGPGSVWTIGFEASLDVGSYGTGAINIANGGQLVGVYEGVLGTNVGAKGTVTVDGAGSAWTGAGFVTVGNLGDGTLNITNGAMVTAWEIFVGDRDSGTGAINFGSHGGTLITETLFGAPAQITGTGTIQTNGLISDENLLFDAAHGPVQDLVWKSIGGNVAVHLDMTGGAIANFCELGAGYQGTGSLTIRDGMVIKSANGYLGYKTGASGSAIIDGAGSTWALGSGLLFVGRQGLGTLSISNGGQVTTGGLMIGLGSLVALNVGDGSALNASYAPILNAGTLRLKALPDLAPGTYYPIKTSVQLGPSTGPNIGVVQALGATWNATTQAFTVAPAATGNAGVPATLDLAQSQRLVITDPTSSKRAVAGFQADSATLLLTALPLSYDQSAQLLNDLPTTNALLTGWNFAASGYTSGDPVLLSLEIGPGYSSQNLALYHFDGTWSVYAAPDLSYDDTFASFTVTSLSAYAVVATPEPATLYLIALAIIPPLLLRSPRRPHMGRDSGRII